MTPSQSEIFLLQQAKYFLSGPFRVKPSQSEIFTFWMTPPSHSYISETLSTEECHQAQKADKVCREPSEQCQDHTCKEDHVTPSKMDHQSRRPRLADTIPRVVTSQGRKLFKSRPQRQSVSCDEPYRKPSY